MSSPIGVCLVHNLEQLFGTLSVLFSQAWNLNAAIFILHDVQKVFVVEQVQAATPVDLEVCDAHGVFFSQLKEFLHQLTLQAIHGEGFAGACLSVGKTSNDSVFGENGQEGPESTCVDVRGFLC